MSSEMEETTEAMESDIDEVWATMSDEAVVVDEANWKSLPPEVRLLSNTASFSFATVHEEEYVDPDIHVVFSPCYYVDKRRSRRSDIEPYMPGILDIDAATAVLKPQSFYGHQSLKAACAAKPKAKSKALAKRLMEASATDVRQFA